MHGAGIVEGYFFGDVIVVLFVSDDGGHFWLGEGVLSLLLPMVSMTMYFCSNICNSDLLICAKHSQILISY
jgi:hypothetical protein